ncbi:hypothetical protein [Holophaga foetida]|uniref:hypothetical protein n=1 Tax=Holophaga foetida TaxID=35839 RepID=UPI0002473704|nr:hypothetical protein [Holophaga foetida]
MRLLKSAFLCLAALVPAMAELSPPVEVTICGVPATVQFDSESARYDTYLVNDKDEWVSDGLQWIPGKPPFGWERRPRALRPGEHLRTFKPEDLKALFDGDPKTAFRFPTNSSPCNILITFKEPQLVDACIIRSGWQKDLKTFNHFEVPTWISVDFEGDEPRKCTLADEENYRRVNGYMRMDGKVIQPPTWYHGWKVKDYPILQPAATSKNMSERLLMFDKPRKAIRLRIEFGVMPETPPVRRHFECEESYVKSCISELLPVLVGHPTGNTLRDGLIEVLRKVRDKKCQELTILKPLPDITKGVGERWMRRAIGEPIYDSFFRLFFEGYIPYYDGYPTIRLAYRGSRIWAYGDKHYLDKIGEAWEYPVLIVDGTGAIVDAWERSDYDGNELP